MRTRNLSAAVLGLLVAVAVGLGILAIGGPETARQERRDQARLSDLSGLKSYVQCITREDGALPDTLPPNRSCGRDVRFTDPATGDAYVYDRLSDREYKLCASFERPELLSGRRYLMLQIDPTTGCTTQRVTIN